MKALRWNFAACDSALVEGLASELGLPPLFARCLAQRGCGSSAEVQAFLHPKLATLSDPFLLPDMDRAVERLFQAHARGEPLVIFGDYDVDGVTATALLTEFFREFGWNCSYYLPHRRDEGYGLSPDAVERCLARFPARLLLAVDCGSSAAAVIERLRERGVEVIVLDHHQAGSPVPRALALVNPQRLTAHEHLKILCSAGLAFKLAHAVVKRGRVLGWEPALRCDLKKFLEYVALGTVADMVPLQAENRIFAQVGLRRLAATARPGLQALKKVAGIHGELGSHEAGFQLAPRLNAAGRLESALEALELLLTLDPARAEFLAETLDRQNRERQAIEQKIAEEVMAAVRARFNPETDFAIVEGDASWHLGVVGIVASRVLREFHRPVLILGSDGSDEWRGSGRSIEGFDLAAGLRQCGDLLVKHGGHALAAGVTLASSKVSEFRARINQLAKSSISPEGLQPVLRLDAEAGLGELTFEMMKMLESIGPTGQGNPPVQLAARKLRLRGELRHFGSARQHLRFQVEDGQATRQAVWWNCPKPEFPEFFDLAFAPELNEYNGAYGIQLKVLDLQPAIP